MRLIRFFLTRFRTKITLGLLVIGVAFLVMGFSGPQMVRAADGVTINWGDISPDVSPDPDFAENDPIAAEINTFFSGAADPHLDPYHGLGSSTGGLSGFNSQTFPNVANSGVDMTVYYSSNNWDDGALEGPDLYQPGSDPNPDRRVTGVYDLRVNSDLVLQRTPMTVVLSFSAPIFMDEYLVASLSNVSGTYEHAIVRAFLTPNATGSVVKASEFINISNLDTCAPLILDQCVDEGPVVTNLLSNVAVDPDLIDTNGDGVYENVGSATDDGVYHVYGVIVQPTGYGRVKLVYGSQAVSSIAISMFGTSATNPDPFTDTDYTNQWISTIVGPHSFTPAGPTAITLSESSASVPNSGLIVIGLALIGLAGVSGLVLRQREVARQEVEK